MTYDNSNNILTTGTFIGELSGNAATMTTNLDKNTNARRYLVFKSSTSGKLTYLTSTNLTFNPFTNTLTAGTFNLVS